MDNQNCDGRPLSQLRLWLDFVATICHQKETLQVFSEYVFVRISCFLRPLTFPGFNIQICLNNKVKGVGFANRELKGNGILF